MERLTQKNPCGLWTTGECEEHYDEQPDGTCISFCYGEAIDRLAAYEDTGLDPEQIADLKDGICMGCSVPAIVSEQQHIQDLLDAENDGRLVVLPCKVGDILYEVDLPEYGVITCKVFSISYYNGPMFHVPGNEEVGSLTIAVEVIDGHGKGSSYNFEIEDFGKHVFLTREEAEAALREADENA